MRCKRIIAHTTTLLLMITGVCQAVIMGRNSLDIDFTKPQEAQSKCTCTPACQLTITQDGLGWDGVRQGLCQGSMQTKPIGVGLTTRPITIMNCDVVIQPPLTATTRPDAQHITPDAGMVYVRYSSDRKHWSSWQALQQKESSPDPRMREGRFFGGTVAIPLSESDEYRRYIMEYSTLDVPWPSDEGAALRWALARDPDLLARHIPFIGFVEFRFDASFLGGSRVTSFHASMGWGVSGANARPKNKDTPPAPRFIANEDGIDSRPASQSSDRAPDASSSDRLFRNRLNILEKTLLGGNVSKAILEVERLKHEFSNGPPPFTERLSTLEQKLSEEMKKQEVEIGNGYLWAHKPEGEFSPPPRTGFADHALDFQRRSNTTTGVTMLRIHIEPQIDESRVTVTTRDLNIVTGGGSYGFTQRAMDGELIMFGADHRSGLRHGTIQIGSLQHAPVSLEIDVPDNQVVYAGEILVRALPPERFGKLLVHVVPEPGLSLEDAHVIVGRPYAHSGEGGYGLRDDGTCLIDDLGEGKCQVCVSKPGVSPRSCVTANVVAGRTSSVELHANAQAKPAR